MVELERLFELNSGERERRMPTFPDLDTGIGRLIIAFNLATLPHKNSGLEWYQKAHQWCQELSMDKDVKLSPESIAGIVAATSPMQSWTRNLVNARELVLNGKYSGLGYTRNDAMRINNGEDPKDVLFNPERNNPKMRAFFMNIAEPDNPEYVTIDRHMFGLLVGTPISRHDKNWLSPDEYEKSSKMVTDTAKALDLVPNQLQAIVWLYWRDYVGFREKTDASGSNLQLF